MEDAFDLAVVVDDDPDIALAARLAARPVRKSRPCHRRANGRFRQARSPDAVLLDLNFERAATDGSEGLDYLARIMAADPEAAVVIITAHSAVSVAVEAIKQGASDFVAKPWSNERLAATVRALPRYAVPSSKRGWNATARRSWRTTATQPAGRVEPCDRSAR